MTAIRNFYGWWMNGTVNYHQPNSTRHCWRGLIKTKGTKKKRKSRMDKIGHRSIRRKSELVNFLTLRQSAAAIHRMMMMIIFRAKRTIDSFGNRAAIFVQWCRISWDKENYVQLNNDSNDHTIYRLTLKKLEWVQQNCWMFPGKKTWPPRINFTCFEIFDQPNRAQLG